MKTLNIKSHAGFSLVEILVAVFVVSIGMLGVARMEILAKESNTEAIQRTTATQLARDIIEKMRANPSQLASFVGVTVGNNSLSAPGTPCNTPSSACKAADLAIWDRYAWEQSLMGTGEKAGNNNTGGLDTPRGCITGPAGGGPGQYVVSIAWKGKSPLKTVAANNCGAGLYGTGDIYRRVLSLTLFISDDGV